VVTSIEVDRRSVFDPESTSVSALSWMYRTLNLLHVRTADSFIRRELLFEEGDCFDPDLLSESARLLDSYGFLSQATITHEDDGVGGERVMVLTRDEWSTQLDVGLTYDDGTNLERLHIAEKNFVGQGILAGFTYHERREARRRSFRLATPRFFGRSDASIAGGQTRPGSFFNEGVSYPFVGEIGRYSVRQNFSRATDFFSYSTDGSEPFAQVLVPLYRETIEVSAARQFGGIGRSIIAGFTFMRDVSDFPLPLEVVALTDFDDLEPFPGSRPPRLDRQLLPTATTRVGLHLGTRRYRYEEYIGLDGVRERQLVGLGMFAGVTIGRGFSVFVPNALGGTSGNFGRVVASFGVGVGASLLHGGMNVEARRDSGEWRDVLVDANVVAYLRSQRLPSHTVFLRVASAGGWRTYLPYQLTLGGRFGVRSLIEDRYPGGRSLRFVVEDRVVLPWPAPDAADLGLTVFADAGRVWPGDVPYGRDSGWQAGLGFGLRIGFPAATRNVWRTDLIFPVGPSSGDPIFRVTLELNRFRYGFFSQDVRRSRRLNLGPEQF